MICPIPALLSAHVTSSRPRPTLALPISRVSATPSPCRYLTWHYNVCPHLFFCIPVQRSHHLV